MAQAPWSIKVDQETKERIDAALEKIVEDGAAATKGEALASLVPAIESEVASAGSPMVAANLAAIKQAQSVISANAAAIAQTLANAEEAARAEERGKFEAVSTALSAARAELEGVKDRLAAAERERDEANARASAVEELYGRFAGLIDRLDKAE